MFWCRCQRFSRNGTILYDGRNRCWKSCRNGNHFISTTDSSVTQQRRGQRMKCQQIGRRPRRNQSTVSHADICRQFSLQLFCKSPCSQPKFQHSFRQIHHFPLIVYPSAIRNMFAVPALSCMKAAVVFPYFLQDLSPCLRFCHCSSPFSYAAISRRISSRISPCCCQIFVQATVSSTARSTFQRGDHPNFWQMCTPLSRKTAVSFGKSGLSSACHLLSSPQ